MKSSDSLRKLTRMEVRRILLEPSSVPLEMVKLLMWALALPASNANIYGKDKTFYVELRPESNISTLRLVTKSQDSLYL